ncbi:MAG: tetratricopeptide repeat protein [Balneolaceae bacterium]|nr:tetratricopeptide repeat protein [Balneolaceae bacterium]MCH8547947.1 tetratricopeptide repeat protein [Balneolaceae bacterium]
MIRATDNRNFCRILQAASLTFLVMLTLSMSVAKAQTSVLIDDSEFRVDAREAIDSLYNRNPHAAKEILKPWMGDEPDHPLWLIWEGMEIWWDVLQDLSSEEYDEAFLEKMARADYAASRILRSESDHPDGLIVRAIANGYIARHHANRGDWLTSVNIGRRAYQAYSRLIEVMPDLPDNDFAVGMKRYYAAFLPENYPVVRAVSWFLPDGDKEEGVNSLRRASEEGVFAAPEASYFLGNILLNYEGDYNEASEHFRQLQERYPDNAYYRRLYLRTLVQMRQYVTASSAADEAIAYWDEHQDRLKDREVLMEEAYYWKGRAAFHNRQREQASNYFVKSYNLGLDLPNRERRQVHTLAAYFAGRSFESLGESDEAEKYYRIAMDQKVSDEARRLARERVQNL